MTSGNVINDAKLYRSASQCGAVVTGFECCVTGLASLLWVIFSHLSLGYHLWVLYFPLYLVLEVSLKINAITVCSQPSPPARDTFIQYHCHRVVLFSSFTIGLLISQSKKYDEAIISEPFYNTILPVLRQTSLEFTYT